VVGSTVFNILVLVVAATAAAAETAVFVVVAVVVVVVVVVYMYLQDDIGLGAVVGSAVFNIMFVISICALFAGSVSNSIDYFIYVKKATVLNTPLTMTMTSDVENSKKLAYRIFTCKCPISYIKMSADRDIVMMT